MRDKNKSENFDREIELTYEKQRRKEKKLEKYVCQNCFFAFKKRGKTCPKCGSADIELEIVY